MALYRKPTSRPLVAQLPHQSPSTRRTHVLTLTPLVAPLSRSCPGVLMFTRQPPPSDGSVAGAKTSTVTEGQCIIASIVSCPAKPPMNASLRYCQASRWRNHGKLDCTPQGWCSRVLHSTFQGPRLRSHTLESVSRISVQRRSCRQLCWMRGTTRPGLRCLHHQLWLTKECTYNTEAPSIHFLACPKAASTLCRPSSQRDHLYRSGHTSLD